MIFDNEFGVLLQYFRLLKWIYQEVFLCERYSFGVKKLQREGEYDYEIYRHVSAGQHRKIFRFVWGSSPTEPDGPYRVNISVDFEDYRNLTASTEFSVSEGVYR